MRTKAFFIFLPLVLLFLLLKTIHPSPYHWLPKNTQNIPQAIWRSFVGVIGCFPELWIGIKTIQIRIRISHVDTDQDPDPDWHQSNADPHSSCVRILPQSFTHRFKIRFFYQCQFVICFQCFRNHIAISWNKVYFFICLDLIRIRIGRIRIGRIRIGKMMQIRPDPDPDPDPQHSCFL